MCGSGRVARGVTLARAVGGGRELLYYGDSAPGMLSPECVLVVLADTTRYSENTSTHLSLMKFYQISARHLVCVVSQIAGCG